MKQSLNRRITVYFLIIMAVMLVVSVTWNYYSTQHSILPPLLALAVALFVLSMMIRRRVVQPIRRISDGIKRFAHHTDERLEPLNIDYQDEIGEIAASFETMTEDPAQATAEAALRPLPVSMSAFATVKEAVFELAGNTSATRKALLACDEALANIVRYSGASELAFGCAGQDGILCVVLRDNGVAFDPAAAVVEEKEFEEFDSGGMGLNMIRQAVSSMEYERKDGTNLLTMRFNFNT